MAIDTAADLREHLQWATQVELSTIPTYLYAMYSIEDDSAEAYRLIRSIVVEEMLHAALTANLQLAVGGQPRFADPAVAPSYPMDLPHHEPPLTLNLERCSGDFIERVCMPIEHPRPVDGLPEDDAYETIEQFYLAIEEAVGRLDDRTGLFDTPQVGRQLTDPGYYTPVEFDVEESGGLHPVDDYESACRAIETVIHQGEGLREERYADPGHREKTHYYKFKQIAEGTYPLGGVRPVPTNPKTADFPPALRPASDLFNGAYTYLFFLLDDLYDTTDRPTKDRLVGTLYAVMTGVLPTVGRFLTARPTSETADQRAAPTFEWYRFEGDHDPTRQVVALAETATQHHPELAPVTTTLEQVGPRPG